METVYLVIGFILLLIIFVIGVYNSWKRSPKAGEIWESLPPDDPFNEDKETFKIIAIRKGYIKYMNITDGVINSMQLNVFKAFRCKVTEKGKTK